MEADMSKEARALLDNPKTRFNIVGAYLLRIARERRGIFDEPKRKDKPRMKLMRRRPYEQTIFLLDSIPECTQDLSENMKAAKESDRLAFDKEIESAINSLRIRVDMLDQHHQQVKKDRGE